MRVSIHAPHAGRDIGFLRYISSLACFNPRAPCGARREILNAKGVTLVFQSTRPMRGATQSVLFLCLKLSVSIHAPHAGRDRRQGESVHDRAVVSIHAPHAGRDVCLQLQERYSPCFNPRAPCGARRAVAVLIRLTHEFQSTRPMRGATDNPTLPRAAREFQSTRPMRGATPVTSRYNNGAGFQSTRPMRGATPGIWSPAHTREVSIHAPHAGRDVL